MQPCARDEAEPDQKGDVMAFIFVGAAECKRERYGLGGDEGK